MLIAFAVLAQLEVAGVAGVADQVLFTRITVPLAARLFHGNLHVFRRLPGWPLPYSFWAEEDRCRKMLGKKRRVKALSTGRLMQIRARLISKWLPAGSDSTGQEGSGGGSPDQIDLPIRVPIIVHIPKAADQIRQPKNAGQGDTNAAVSLRSFHRGPHRNFLHRSRDQGDQDRELLPSGQMQPPCRWARKGHDDQVKDDRQRGD